MIEKDLPALEIPGDSTLRRRRLEIGHFLRQRRAALRPQDVGLPAIGRRHVKGLRREELASVAGISASWYALLEQGRAETVTSRTMGAIADALRLEPIERHHLLELANASYCRTGAELAPPSDALVRFVRSYPAEPAHLHGANFDLLAYNEACADFFYLNDRGPRPNLLRVMAEEPLMRARFVRPTWETVFRAMIGHFRVLYARFGGAELDVLAEELGETSAFFRSVWHERALFAMPPNPIVVCDAKGTRACNVFGFVVPETPSHYIVFHAPATNV